MPKVITRKDAPINAVFDIETGATEKGEPVRLWDKFLCGGVLHDDGAYEAFDWKHESTFADRLLSIDGALWSHNGGAFDMKWLLDRAIERELKVAPLMAGSRIVSMRIGSLQCYDSKALTKISLAELTKGFEIEKQETGIPCVCSESCGGYCSFSRRMPATQYSRVLEYMEADCRALMLAMLRVREFCREHDLDFGATVGGSAWNCARRWLDLPPAKLSPNSHGFVRQAYFGGRVQLFRPQSSGGFEADVNSMYPSQLAFKPLPSGEPEHAFGSTAAHAFREGKPGIYRADVSVPEMHLPPLPCRMGDGRIAYPTGSFEGTWTAPELHYAEECGVKIDGIWEGMVYPFERIVFREWVEKLFALRSGAPLGKKGPLGTFLKFYLNSLTGKLGSRPENERMIINPDEDTDLEGFRPFGLSGFIFLKDGYRLDPCAHVEWAAYLTSTARIEWHRQATSVGDGWNSVYGDTDSLFYEVPLIRNMVDSDELGKWKNEGAFKNFIGIAPKVYRFERKATVQVKAKGCRLPKMKDQHGQWMPENVAKADQMIQGGELIAGTSIIGFRKGAKTGVFFKSDTVGRHVSQGYGDRILEPGHECTRAPTFIEAQTQAGRE